MITTLFSNKRLTIFLYVLLVILSIGLGMGVPFFTILLGLPVGWFLPPYLELPAELNRESLQRLLKFSTLTSAVSFLVLAAIWLPSLSWLFNPDKDLGQFGMPLILYEPLSSFLGWIALMVLVSPFLQFLMTVLGSVVRLAYFQKNRS